MQRKTLTRQTFAAEVRASGIALEVLAVATGKSYATVYAYLTDRRNPSDEWIAQCEVALAMYGKGRAA
jgi:hypothetical protein